MQILRAADHRRMPWKNGGGETTEVLCLPAGAGLDAFDLRISMARVAADGPFSAFAGVDRTLALLDGDGLVLTIAGREVVLAPGAPPCPFPGDVPTSARLRGGPITDLNAMTRRGRLRHEVVRLAGAARLAGAPVVVVARAPMTVSDGAATARLARDDAAVGAALEVTALDGAGPLDGWAIVVRAA